MTPNPKYGPYSKIDRRGFLKAAGLGIVSVGLGSSLAACGQATPEATAQVGGALQFLSWEGYDLPTCMAEWQAAHGVTMELTYIGDHSEIQAKLATATGVGYDLITYYQGYYDLYRDELQIIQSLDTSKLPNLASLYERFREQVFWKDAEGKVWGAPSPGALRAATTTPTRSIPPPRGVTYSGPSSRIGWAWLTT